MLKLSGETSVGLEKIDNCVTEYLILEDGELWLTRSDKRLKSDVEAIKKKLEA